MPKLSEKYIAGFLDADGYMGLQFRGIKPTLILGFSQKSSKDDVLNRIQSEIGGSKRVKIINGASYSDLTLCSKSAKKALNRIKKYLVIKRNYAHACLDVAEKKIVDKQDAIKNLKFQRLQKSYPLPNFPTRKWLAGYFDGDGCLSVMNTRKPFGQAHIVVHIASSNFDTEGIEILHKSFGGAIHGMRNGRCKQWVLSLDSPSKAKEFLGYFGKHSIVKRDQILFVLGCAEMGHYRDGKNIKSVLKQLKSQEQRLSESGVAKLIGTIKDLPKQKRSDYGDFARNNKGQIIGKKAA